jgi:hypothetical protein
MTVVRPFHAADFHTCESAGTSKEPLGGLYVMWTPGCYRASKALDHFGRYLGCYCLALTRVSSVATVSLVSTCTDLIWQDAVLQPINQGLANVQSTKSISAAL